MVATRADYDAAGLELVTAEPPDESVAEPQKKRGKKGRELW